MLDQYCERAGDPALWAEPLNALSNLAFIAAAALALGEARRHCTPAMRFADIHFLVAIVFVIGLGSGAWHLVPVGPTLLADVLPITIFIHVYLGAFLVRVVGLRWPMAVAIVIGFLALGLAVGNAVPRGTLNGSVGYLPAWSALAVLTIVLFRRRHPLALHLLAILGIWTVSLAFRTVDRSVCEAVPLGTHWLWHLLNAIVLGLLLRLLVHNERLRRAGSAGQAHGIGAGAVPQ